MVNFHVKGKVAGLSGQCIFAGVFERVFFQDGNILGQTEDGRNVRGTRAIELFLLADPCVKMEPLLQKAFMN